MKPIIPPVEFFSPLSKAEARMSLRELCGSKWDKLPFEGKVDENSFRLVKNRFFFSQGLTRPLLVGSLAEQDGKTKVTVELVTKISDIVGWLLVIIGILGFAGYSFAYMLDKGTFAAIASSVSILVLGTGLIALSYFFIRLSFHNCVNKIKKALGSTLQ